MDRSFAKEEKVLWCRIQFNDLVSPSKQTGSWLEQEFDEKHKRYGDLGFKGFAIDLIVMRYRLAPAFCPSITTSLRHPCSPLP